MYDADHNGSRGRADHRRFRLFGWLMVFGLLKGSVKE